MLSDNLKHLRKTKGLSQQELALKLHVVRQTVSKWEKGTSVPDSEMLIRIAQELDSSVNVLLGESLKPDETPDEKEELRAIAAKLELLNEQFARRCEQQRKIWRTVFIILGVIVVLALLYELAGLIQYWFSMNEMYADSSVIGGYDGPTDIYVSSISLNIGALITAIIAAIISAVGLYKTRRK